MREEATRVAIRWKVLTTSRLSSYSPRGIIELW